VLYCHLFCTLCTVRPCARTQGNTAGQWQVDTNEVCTILYFLLGNIKDYAKFLYSLIYKALRNILISYSWFRFHSTYIEIGTVNIFSYIVEIIFKRWAELFVLNYLKSIIYSTGTQLYIRIKRFYPESAAGSDLPEAWLSYLISNLAEFWTR
jgi:hypothetical protein